MALAGCRLSRAARRVPTKTAAHRNDPVMNQSSQPSILFIGPTPPPHQGVAVTTDCLLHSSLSGNFRIIHLDISDRRTMDNCGHLDFGNVYLALVHGARFLALFFRERPDIVYVPISQNALG